MAESISNDGRVYMFGSGHSVIPVLDIFPRYGSFVGFFPLYDPRLMWWNVIGPGGARELLWLERQEGYARVFLQSYPLEERDAMLVFSHGGLNAAPIEMALEAKAKGLKVITVSSHANVKIARRSHSSGKVLSEVADVAIDNCVPPEDSLVDVGQLEKSPPVRPWPPSPSPCPSWPRPRRSWRRRGRSRRHSSLRTSTAFPRTTWPVSIRRSPSSITRRPVDIRK